MSGIPHVFEGCCVLMCKVTMCSDRTLVNSENGISFLAVLTAANETQRSLHFHFSVSRASNRENTKGEGNTGISSSQIARSSVI